MRLTEWIINGEVGSSSKTMWYALTGESLPSNQLGSKLEIPYDGDDFSRCYKLVVNCNISKEQLLSIPKIFPFWKPFIDEWDTLCSMYENKKPMYEFMKPLVYKSRIIAGWEDKGNGCWSFNKGKDSVVSIDKNSFNNIKSLNLRIKQ